MVKKVKQIIINNESVLPYEYLLLFGGETFQKVDTSYTVLTPGERKTVAVADSPHNVFYINCESDAFNALLAVKSIMRRQKTYNIVVYGHNMESYCCINVLLEFGVKGPTITYIDPIPRSGFIDPYCHDKKVNDAIVAYLHEKEVTIYSDYCFVDWTMNPNQSNICSAKFQTRTKYIDIQCDALFFYGNKDVSVQTFSASSCGFARIKQ
uniref:Uncharacterized protein n=1 Tax=Timema douglasi TaxID=61478 RepID=A0A7R8VUR5_TIMDO|nr:unnamed protein product [Timema douglasi]